MMKIENSACELQALKLLLWQLSFKNLNGAFNGVVERSYLPVARYFLM
jgi:hypothetical protein